MILETSALVAILTDEEGAAALSRRLADAGRVIVPAHVLLEASMVLVGRKTPEEIADLDAYLARIHAEVLPFTAAHARGAREAFLRYGKGRHPAGLNFGDCMSYAVAQVERLPLLYVGDDFARTDITAA